MNIAERAQTLELDWYEYEFWLYSKNVTLLLCTSVSDVSEPANNGGMAHCANLFQSTLHKFRTDSLKSAIMEVFISQKSAKATNQDIFT